MLSWLIFSANLKKKIKNQSVNRIGFKSSGSSLAKLIFTGLTIFFGSSSDSGSNNFSGFTDPVKIRVQKISPGLRIQLGFGSTPWLFD